MKKLLFLLFLIPIAGVSQNKKEQIATLNFKLDSLNNKISNERQASKKEIEENEKKMSSQKAQLIKLYDRVKKLNESLESEKANLNAQKLKNIEIEKLNNKYEQEIGKLNESQEGLSAANNQLKESLSSLDSIYNLLTISYDSVIKNKVDTKTEGFLANDFEGKLWLNDFNYDYADDGMFDDDLTDEELEFMEMSGIDYFKNDIYFLGYNNDKIMYFVYYSSEENDVFNSWDLIIQSLSENKSKSVFNIDIDDSYDYEGVLYKEKEEYLRVKLVPKEVNGKRPHSFPKAFISEINKEIQLNNIIPGIGKFINSDSIYAPNLNLKLIETKTDLIYKLTASNNVIEKVIFSNKYDKEEEDDDYDYLGCYELPGTDYLAVLLMAIKHGSGPSIDETLKIIPYKYK